MVSETKTTLCLQRLLTMASQYGQAFDIAINTIQLVLTNSVRGEERVKQASRTNCAIKNQAYVMNITTIKLENITKAFTQNDQQVHVLKNFTTTFKKGTSYAITGRSGAGKTTLLHIAAALEAPTKGNVFFGTIVANILSAKEKSHYWNHYLGFVFQQPYLIAELSTLENIMLKGLMNGVPRSKLIDMAYKTLEQLGLDNTTATLFPSQLSGGQQQRVALARALVDCPDFLFADEPTGNVDEHTGAQLIKTLRTYQKTYGMGLIVSTHDKILAEQFDYIIRL